MSPEKRLADRVVRASSTLLSTSALSFLTMGIGFVTTPILLRLLGPDRLGANRLIVDWFGYIALAEVGVGPAFSVFLLRVLPSDNEATIDGLLHYGFRFLTKVAAVLVPMGILLAIALPSLVIVPPELKRELQEAAFVSALSLCFYPFGIFKNFLDASQRGASIQLSLLLQSLTTTGLSLAFAYAGGGLVGLSGAAFIGLGLSSVYVSHLARRGRKPLRKAIPFVVERKELWSTSWPIAIASLANRLNLLTDTITVGYLLGARSVATLFFTQRLMMLGAGQVTGLVHASWAGLADLHARGENETFAKRIDELTILLVGAGTVVSATVAAFNESFIALWVGSDEYGGLWLVVATAASNVLFGFILFFSWLIDAHGHTRRRLRVSIVGSLLNFVLSVIGTKLYGLAGVAVGTAIAFLLTEAWYTPLVAVRLFGLDGYRVARAALRGLALGLLWCAAICALRWFVPGPRQWFPFFGEFGIVGVASLGYCWAIILRADDRMIWRARLTRLLRSS